MKTFIISAVAASLLATPILAAAPADAAQRRVQETTVVRHGPHRTVVTKREVVRTPAHRNWRKGQRFDRRYASNYRVVSNYRHYRLHTPPRGYHWVRSGNDAVLVAIGSGVIGAVIANAIR